LKNFVCGTEVILMAVIEWIRFKDMPYKRAVKNDRKENIIFLLYVTHKVCLPYVVLGRYTRGMVLKRLFSFTHDGCPLQKAILLRHKYGMTSEVSSNRVKS
jgi:hypothetical protein